MICKKNWRASNDYFILIIFPLWKRALPKIIKQVSFISSKKWTQMSANLESLSSAPLLTIRQIKEKPMYLL
jgi:hypothetical protein